MHDIKLNNNLNDLNKFDAIRPYNDNEVITVLNRLINNKELQLSLTKLLFPRLYNYLSFILRILIKLKLKYTTNNINTIHKLQYYIKPYLINNLFSTTSNITFSGIDKLDNNKAYLFISNHRDIVMDPALINYLVDKHNLNTPRLAIGDNLLQKDFVADLMRLNKSFIVMRSIKNKREKLNAVKLLSQYIYTSLIKDKSSIWIAQAEGRAKNGNDKTSSAMLKMLNLANCDHDFNSFISSFNIVPVSISYELDPCDYYKAHELYEVATNGKYVKQQGEDDRSIALGVTEFKGNVNVHFDVPINGKFNNVDELATYIDNIIYANYKLYPINYIAYELWNNKPSNYINLNIPNISNLYNEQQINNAKKQLNLRLNNQQNNNSNNKELQQFIIMQYAYPVYNYYLSKQSKTN